MCVPGSSMPPRTQILAGRCRRVKVVDKRAEGGRVYLKKGTVVDVAMPRVCDVHLDDLARTVQVGGGGGGRRTLAVA